MGTTKTPFSAFNPTNGNELWITDGTTGCTMLVKHIYPGALISSLQPFRFTNTCIGTDTCAEQ